MADSFQLAIPEPDASAPPAAAGSRPCVVVTGAAGRIGRSFVASAADRYAFRLLDHPDADPAPLAAQGELHRGDIADVDWVADLFAGADAVVHLAADPAPDADWPSLPHNNIVGTRSVFRAAIRARVRRVVFASSIHAVSGAPAGRQVHADEPVCPGDEYGVSKCFGEAMARYAATQHGLSCICIRIGAFQPRDAARDPDNIRFMNSFVSHRDLDQLIRRCVDDRRLRFAIVHGLSNNRFNRMDIETARELLGYRPQDDFAELNEALAALALRQTVQPHDESH